MGLAERKTYVWIRLTYAQTVSVSVSVFYSTKELRKLLEPSFKRFKWDNAL